MVQLSASCFALWSFFLELVPRSQVDTLNQSLAHSVIWLMEKWKYKSFLDLSHKTVKGQEPTEDSTSVPLVPSQPCPLLCWSSHCSRTQWPLLVLPVLPDLSLSLSPSPPLLSRHSWKSRSQSAQRTEWIRPTQSRKSLSGSRHFILYLLQLGQTPVLQSIPRVLSSLFSGLTQVLWQVASKIQL